MSVPTEALAADDGTAYDAEGFIWPSPTDPVPTDLTDSELVATEAAAIDWTFADLRLWTPESYPPVAGFPLPNWWGAGAYWPNGECVYPLYNAQPTLFYSDSLALWTVLDVAIAPNGHRTTDDDYVGFAVGYRPGDASNPAANYLLMDWRKVDQFYDFNPDLPDTPGTTANEGMALSRVFGVLYPPQMSSGGT